MSFQSKTFLSVLRSMIERMRSTTFRITNFTPGSVSRMYFDAPAQEIDQLYQQMLFGLLEAIPVAIYTAFNFPPLPPVAASGLIRIILAPQNTSAVLAQGTVFTPSGGSPTFQSTSAATIAFGSNTSDIPVVASVTDVAGNLLAGTQFTVGVSIPGFVSASNIAAFSNGAPQETPSAQKVRFKAFVQTLSRGTVASLIYALTRLVSITDNAGNTLERVVTAAIVEPYLANPSNPPGLVLAYVHNGVGLTSTALVTQAAAVVNGYTSSSGAKVPGFKAIGTQFQAFAAAEEALNVTGMLTIAPTVDKEAISAQAMSAVYGYVQQIPVGDPYLPAVANDLVMAIKGVWNWMPVFPRTVFAPAPNTKLMPGDFEIIGWLAAATVVRTQTVGYLLTADDSGGSGGNTGGDTGGDPGGGGGPVASKTIDAGYIENLGWVNITANPITYLSVTYTVPPAPSSDDGQILYLWGGIQSVDGKYLLQPVLQWGDAASGGGGSFWSLSTYWLSTDPNTGQENPFVASPPIQVTPGTTIQCVVTCTGGTRGQSNFSYTAQFVGYPGSFYSVSGIEELNYALIALEAYPDNHTPNTTLVSCSDYPGADFTTMGSIVVRTGTPGTAGSPITPPWQAPVNFTDCGEGITGTGDSFNFYYRNVPTTPGPGVTFLTSSSSVPPSTPTSDQGFVLQASWRNLSSNPLVYVAATYTVPPAPVTAAGQAVSLWIGVTPTDNSVVIQPVLQWREDLGGWVIFSTIANSSGDIAVTPNTSVQPGNVLTAEIVCTSTSDGQYNYTSQFKGYPLSGQVLTLQQEQTIVVIAMEVDNPTVCGCYPAGATVFSPIVVNIGAPGTTGTPVSQSWEPQEFFTDCGTGIVIT